MRCRLRWRRSSPNSTINFDLVLENPEDLDVERVIALLERIREVEHRKVTLSNRADMEFQRWFGDPATPLGSEAYVLLSNWFLTKSGDRHSMVANRCEPLWDLLFPCRPERRLSSPAPGQNHVMLPAEFESFWRLLSQAQGEDVHEAAGLPTASNFKEQSRTAVLAEDIDGSRPDHLRATVRMKGLDCVVEGLPRAVADFLQMVIPSVAAEGGKHTKQRPVESASMTACPGTIIDALTGAGNTDENALTFIDQVNPANLLNSKMATLTDDDLWHALNYFYPKFHNLISGVARTTGMSVGHVQRVLVGDRTSTEVRTAIVKEFRRRIQTKDGPGGHFDEVLQP